MADATEDQIRSYAHQLWENAGKPEGRDQEFWHQAAQQLRTENESSNPDADPMPKVLPG
jgi:hypothetical protein